MPFRHIADPDQLTILTKALDEHCQSLGIPSDSPERENLASRVISLFSRGTTTLDELKEALAKDGA
ncbi:hypothetical protein [Mesorhizobium sp. M0589]|uniref:hypothetical protein n=1 Tax=Mesorhizobium sp. M0589 TaxID=2956965 RepID=UPI00333D3607